MSLQHSEFPNDLNQQCSGDSCCWCKIALSPFTATGLSVCAGYNRCIPLLVLARAVARSGARHPLEARQVATKSSGSRNGASTASRGQTVSLVTRCRLSRRAARPVRPKQLAGAESRVGVLAPDVCVAAGGAGLLLLAPGRPCRRPYILLPANYLGARQQRSDDDVCSSGTEQRSSAAARTSLYFISPKECGSTQPG